MSTQGMILADEDSMRLLIERVRDYAIFTLDPQGHVTSWNPAAQRIKRYTAEEIIGQHFSMLYLEEDAKAGKPMRNLAIAARDGVFHEEGLRLRKNQEVYWADVEITPLREDGVLRGFAKIVRDIDVRKRTEERLRETTERLLKSEERARLLIDSATAYAIIGLDLEGRITEWNAGAELLFGHAREDAASQAIDLVFVPEDREQGVPRQELEVALREQRSADDRWLRRKDGTRFFASGVVMPLLDPDGRPTGFAKVVRDMTEGKLAEEQLRQARDDAQQRAASLIEAERSLQEANRRLEQFAAIASHDLKEPLRLIQAYLELLDRRYGERLDERAREYLRVATDSARRAQRLIQSFLQLHRVGQAEVRIQPVALLGVFVEARNALAARISEARASITHDELPVVDGDPGLLENLFQNLIGNAIKYVAPGTIPQVHVSCEDAGGRWRISFRDNGIGIARQDQERIFQPLERIHTQREYPGSGLGLAICSAIVARHGGRIWADSLLGTGSTFHVELPKASRQ